MDNATGPLLFPTPHVERTTWFHHLAKPRVASAVTDDGLPDVLIAQPGFSALVEGDERGSRANDPLRRRCDADRRGRGHSSARSCQETSRRSCSATVTGTTSPGWRESPGRSGVETAVRSTRLLAASAHSDSRPRSGRAASDQPPSVGGRGFEIVEERQPSFLLDSSVLVTGEVDERRRSRQALWDTKPRFTAAGSQTR